jgi:hypothetical protein
MRNVKQIPLPTGRQAVPTARAGEGGGGRNDTNFKL